MKYFISLPFIILLSYSCKESTSPEPEPNPDIDTKFLVNTLNEGNQFNPQIAALDSGNFVVVWCSSTDGQNYELKGQLFNQVGSKIDSEFCITTNIFTNFPHFIVTSLINGFNIQWHFYDDKYIYSLSFDQKGNKIGYLVQHDAGNWCDSRHIDTALLSNNDIITVYCPFFQDSLYFIIRDQTGWILERQGILKIETEGSITFPRVCGLNDSTFVVIWEYLEDPVTSQYSMHLMQQFFKKDGTPKDDPSIIVSYRPDILYPEIIPLDWGFLVSWKSQLCNQLMCQYFDQNGDYHTEKTIISGYGDYQFFKLSMDYQLIQLSMQQFAVISYGNYSGISLTEYGLYSNAVCQYTSSMVYEQKEDWIDDVKAQKISDNKIAIVWDGKYEDDYNIYATIYEF